MSESQRAEFEAAIESAIADPRKDKKWEEVESLAGQLDSPDEVAAAYREVLQGSIDPAVAVAVGKRAARFHEEWYGQDAAGLAEVLTRVLEIDGSSEWAFQRLTVVLTVGERWDELLHLYDRAIAAAPEKRRAKLLEEAYQSARDLAGAPEKAISYLQQLYALRPKKKLANALERLLERHERWEDLLSLWESQLGDLKPADRTATRLRIAETWLEKLSNPGEALEATQKLLFDLDGADADPALGVLERVLTSDNASVEVRAAALQLLRERYVAAERPAEVVRVLEAAIAHAEGDAQRALRKEVAQRLVELGEHRAAVEHWGALLKMQPGSVVTQRALRQAATQCGEIDRYTGTLIEAAGFCDDVARRVALLSDAANTHLEALSDRGGAIDLYMQALALEEIGASDILAVGRHLVRLLGEAERNEECVQVLERMAEAESVPSSRRAIIGDIGALAARLGDTDRALAAWKHRLEDDPTDIVALDSVVSLLEQEQRWEPLVEALQRRAEAQTQASRNRADLVRAAEVVEQSVGDSERAIAGWLLISEKYGEQPDAVESLTRLYQATGRWPELAELLDRASRVQTDVLGQRLSHLGAAYAEQLGSEQGGIDCFRRCLAINPRHESARRSLSALLENPSYRGTVADILARAYRDTEEWNEFLELVEPRLQETEDQTEQFEILREAAHIREKHSNDPATALSLYCRAFPLAPEDRALEEHATQLARQVGQWGELTGSYRSAITALEESNPRAAARLCFRLGTLLDSELEDDEGALASYLQVISVEPNNLPATAAVVRIGANLGRWDNVAAAVCTYAHASGRAEESLLGEMENTASRDGAFAALCNSLDAAIQAQHLSASEEAEIGWWLARWQRDHLDDTSAAIARLTRVTSLEPHRVEAMLALAELQRANRGPELFETSRKLCDLVPQNLDHFKEAAELAAEFVEDVDLRRNALTALFGKASAAWRKTTPMRGSADPETCVTWAIEKLVESYCASGDHRAALDLLMDASRLPFDADTRRSLRLRAAGIADETGDTAGAIEMYRAILTRDPGHAEANLRLAELYAAQDRTPELLALKRQELAAKPGDDRRLALRLEIVDLLADLERRGGRVEVLTANLEESPGHEDSISQLIAVLSAHGRHQDLLEQLVKQANVLESMEQPERAVELWTTAAGIAEERVLDREAAIDSYRRVVALSPSPAALDSLARLSTEAGRPGEAVPWLEQRLASAEAEERATIVARLAQAHLGAEREDRAIGCLERALREGNADLANRKVLVDLYRKTETWEPLADLLTDSLEHLEDSESQGAWAREAADIYTERLAAPAKAIPALRKATELDGKNRKLRLLLARGLRVAGSQDEARTLLEGLISEFGRRRSKERASIHVELAQVAREQSQLDDAVKELELASRMDVSNAHIMKLLAETARENGDLEQAERSLRALLLLVRRQPPGDDVSAIGTSEVLYELSLIARAKDDEDQAEELFDSTVEAAIQSDSEVKRLRRTLLAHNQPKLLLEIFHQRLDASDDSLSQAQLYRDVAQLFEGPLDSGSDALEARLKSLELEPSNLENHDRTRAVAKSEGKSGEYVEQMETVVDKLRRQDELSLSGEILMRIGAVAEEDLSELNQAASFYRRAQKVDSCKAAALYALARVCGALGESEEQGEALGELRRVAMESERAESRADALYRLAELELGTTDYVGQGLESIRQALEVEPRYAHAGQVLQRAATQHTDNAELFALYGEVARASHDPDLLLDYLERRAELPDTTPDQVREAVELATSLGRPERGEALLSRAIQAARDSGEGLTAAMWAVTGLIRVHIAAGNLVEANELFSDIGGSADPTVVRELGLEIATSAAAEGSTLGLAADVYETLRQFQPLDRDIWSPLFDVYRQMNESEKLNELVMTTLPGLMDLGDRNHMRRQAAQFFIDQDKKEEAAELLRNALLDDPDDNEAATVLATLFRTGGDDEALADFLLQRFDEAKQRDNPETVASVALELGTLLHHSGGGDPLEIYQQALEFAPESPELLKVAIHHTSAEAAPVERAGLMERLLAVSSAEDAPRLSLELADVWQELEDDDGVRRTLETGYQVSGFDQQIRARLDQFYRDRQMWSSLVDMMVREGEALEDPKLAVALFRDAATVCREQLEDLGAAADVLAKARSVDPSNSGLVVELANTLASANNAAAAISAITAALDNEISGSDQVELLLARAQLRFHVGEPDAAIEDLETGYGLEPDGTLPVLLSGLEERRQLAQEQCDTDAERRMTLRLADLRIAGGDEEGARELLLRWIERVPQDREALCRVRDMDTEAERWDGVLAACGHLALIDEGDDQVDAALRHYRAAEQLNAPEQARGTLEHVFRVQPSRSIIREYLRHIYEANGARRELADLLLVDADFCEDADSKYSNFRTAADILVNELGDTEAALPAAQKAQELRPDDHETILLLVDIMTAAGRVEDASAMLEPAIKMHKRRSPELASLQYRMARVHAALGDQDSQLHWLKKAFDVDRKDGVIAAELAHLATELGDYDLALKPLRAITLMDSPGPVTRVMALLWEAKIEHARGNRAKAELWAKKALREDPSFAEAEEFLSQISD